MGKENIDKKIKQLEERVKFINITLILIIVALSVVGIESLVLDYYQNKFNSQISENYFKLLNISQQMLQNLDKVVAIVATHEKQLWDNDGRIDNLFQKNINLWKMENNLSNYNWMNSLEGCDKIKTFIGVKPWRVYNDVLIFEIDDGSEDLYTLWERKNKEVECFKYGINVNCTDLICEER